jgi:hypothetical protein
MRPGGDGAVAAQPATVIASPAISPIRILLSTAGVYRRTEVRTDGHTAGRTTRNAVRFGRTPPGSNGTVRRQFPNFRLANQVPMVNVAAFVAILLSVIPVYLATRLSGGVVGARLNPASASGGRTRGLPLEARLDDHEPERQREESVGDDLAHGRPPPVAHPSGPMR